MTAWVKHADNADLVAYALQERARACASGSARAERMVMEAAEAYSRVAPTVQKADELRNLFVSLSIFLDRLERMASASGSLAGGRFGSASGNLEHLQDLIDQAQA